MSQLMNRFCRLVGQPESQKETLKAYFLCSLVTLIILLLPAKIYYENNKSNYLEQSKISDWIKSNLNHISKNNIEISRSHKNNPNPSAKSLFSVISNTNQKDMLSRIEQRGSTVFVSIDKARLSEVLKWLGELENRHDIKIQNTAITYIEGDTVNSQIIFAQ